MGGLSPNPEKNFGIERGFEESAETNIPEEQNLPETTVPPTPNILEQEKATDSRQAETVDIPVETPESEIVEIPVDILASEAEPLQDQEAINNIFKRSSEDD